MKDPLFGPLKFDSGKWLTTTTLPYFRGCGTYITDALVEPLPTAQPFYIEDDEYSPPDADDEETTFRQGNVELHISSGGSRKNPIDTQRAAWQTVLDRGDALFDEILQAGLQLYQSQRPTRVALWQRIFGDYMLNFCLSDISTIDDFRPLIAPLHVLIKPDGTVGFHFAATWHPDGFAALVRDGQLLEVGHISLVFPLTQTTGPAVDIPPFGRLARIGDDSPMELINQWQISSDGITVPVNIQTSAFPWLGHVRFDPFLHYAYILDDRLRFSTRPINYGSPSSKHDWDFINRVFEVRVHTPASTKPSPAQAAAFSTFLTSRDTLATSLLDAIRNDYPANLQARRDGWKDNFLNETLPSTLTEDHLRDTLQLKTIHVHPAQDGIATLGFQFVAAYTYAGIGIRVREGQIISIGDWKHAEPSK